MAYVMVAPEVTAAAATDLATIGSNLGAAHMVAEASTVALLPAAADEVSASIAHLFSRHAEDYQAMAGKAAAFHEQFAQHLTAAANSYAGAEAVNSALLRPLTPSARPVADGDLQWHINGFFNTVKDFVVSELEFIRTNPPLVVLNSLLQGLLTTVFQMLYLPFLIVLYLILYFPNGG
jgi:hypothetical protein